MNISIVVAYANNFVIGNNNAIPWHLPSDLKYFKKITTGHCILMGRKCFESIGKALPNRTNLIITRDKNYKAENCLIFHDFESAEIFAKNNNETELMIIGGGEVYNHYITKANKLYTTEVRTKIDGNTYFPKPDFDKYILIQYIEGIQDEKNKFSYCFKTWKLKN